MLMQFFELFRVMVPITMTEGARLILIYGHLLLCSFAITMVLYTDLRIAAGSFTRQGLKQAAHLITWILFWLWMTGLAIIYLDTGFDPEILATKSKLLLKLLTVVVLTINGIVLHKISFPVILDSEHLRLRESILLAVTGALSTSHWLLAAFVGVAKPFGRIPLESLLIFYAFYCSVTILIALVLIPSLRQRLNDWHRSASFAVRHGERTERTRVVSRQA